MRTVDPVTGQFVIKDRGTVWTTIEPDPLYEVNEIVLMDGEQYKILGIERHCITPAPGRNIGLLMRRIDA